MIVTLVHFILEIQIFLSPSDAYSLFYVYYLNVPFQSTGRRGAWLYFKVYVKFKRRNRSYEWMRESIVSGLLIIANLYVEFSYTV